jgi:flagellar basal body L-ring protein FlgH
MKFLAFITLVLSFLAMLSSCDVRSETAKKEMEKFSGTPTPVSTPAPTPPPVDPADVVQVDTSLEGEVLGINGAGQKKSVNCNKYNAVRINGDSNVLKVSGTCRQIMLNGDNNEVTADAAMEFVFNGTGNILKHARYANGKRPSIVQGQQGNTVEKIPFEAGKSGKK